MKTIIKPVYYCDFCKKKGLSKWHMIRHEKKCTGNPKRICGVCGGIDIGPLIAKYHGRFTIKEQDGPFPFMTSSEIEWIGEPVTQEMILDDVDGCPACGLAVVRLSGLLETSMDFHYDYHEAHRQWWADRNEEYHRQEENYY